MSKRYLSCLLLSIAFVLSPLTRIAATAQEATRQDQTSAQNPTNEILRLERIPIAGGAELITIHARLEGLETGTDQNWIPMVSVLRDTLGDLSPENDRLRYLWPLTYTRPTFKQRLAGAVPFFYTRMGNKRPTEGKVPPPIMDLAAPERQVWEKLFWTALKNVLLDPYGAPVKASTDSYRRNITDYRKSHIIRALSVLSLYQALDGPAAFSGSEMGEIQARLLLTDKTFGGWVDDLNLQRYYERKRTGTRDERAHNWELLRQRAEAESLSFEPLEMPDGSMTHALLWVAKPDLETKRNARYDGRFLNIADPWSDKRLVNWKGYVETRYFDAENRPVAADAEGARPVEMIPLALYGLDNPKIPMLLVDFRDTLNPKRREMSRRVLQDVTRNVLSVSRFGNLSYFLGRTVFDYVTGKRGMDLNQPSRLRTYSQLKLLLALNDSLNPELRQEIDHRLEKVSLNPLENDLAVEAKLAKTQYDALMAYAQQPDGLAAKLDRDRRSEMVPLEHSKKERVFLRAANILSFGIYSHREESTPELEARLDVARRLSYHTKFLRQVAKSTPQIEVAWNLEEVRRSLHFVAEHGAAADSGAASATGKIFTRTEDAETRRACLDSLSRMTSRKARNELLRLSQIATLDPAWKEIVLSYLEPNKPDGLAASAVKASANRVEQR
ncbi:MAG TPA: hypothetical protein VJM12_21680 [Pyrinomonadaceae bacterium]|nr:hypothetical protein [Pyrinomonadaceae bacterium]